MQIIKYCMLFFIFVFSTLIGKYISRSYKYRLEELKEIKNSLNVFKSKIKFTYDPIAEIFEEIAKNTSKNVSQLFIMARENMNNETASLAWENAVDKAKGNFNKEDKQTLKTLSKLLGITDTEGQISQIEITETFLDKQIRQAEEEKNKNEKLYNKLGGAIGLVIVIILI